mgnify:CR=1 FL=1
MIKLSEMPKGTRSGAGRVEKYPFDEWFIGTPVFLAEGSDYQLGKDKDGKPSDTGFLGTLRQAAKRRNLSVSIVKQPEGENGKGVAIISKPYVPRPKKAESKGNGKGAVPPRPKSLV